MLDKGRLVHELAEQTLGLRVPSRTTATITDLTRIASSEKDDHSIKLPVVIKASKGSGGQGVYIAHTYVQLQSGARQIMSSIRLGVSESLIGRAHGDVGAYLEEYINGSMAIGIASYHGQLLSAVCSWTNATSSPTVLSPSDLLLAA
jgi:biotin carboxylase